MMCGSFHALIVYESCTFTVLRNMWACLQYRHTGSYGYDVVYMYCDF